MMHHISCLNSEWLGERSVATSLGLPGVASQLDQLVLESQFGKALQGWPRGPPPVGYYVEIVGLLLDNLEALLVVQA